MGFLRVQLLLLGSVLGVWADLTNLDTLHQEADELISLFGTYYTHVNNDAFFVNESSSVLNFGTYDFIIVGGGTAGGVLANRLTEEDFTILVLEAGTPAPDTTAIVGLSPYFFHSEWNWGYNTTRQTNGCLAANNQQCPCPRGKVLGGSSDINAAFYIRGNAKDFDYWAELGNINWSYADVLPYFKKAEKVNLTSYNPEYHGTDGPQTVGVIEDSPILTQALLDGFAELGLPEVDYNGENQLGYSRFQNFLTSNIRSSTNYSYISPAAFRSNLKISTGSLVTKIIIEKNTAVGVEFVKNGQHYTASARKEVLVSAGSINTPQVLMLSGIGPAAQLETLNITVVADLPVGQNLQDHMIFNGLLYRTNVSLYNNSLENMVELWIEDHRPLTAGYGAQVISFYDFDNDTVPDLEIYALGPRAADPNLGTLVVSLTKEYSESYYKLNPVTDIILAIVPLHPASVGEVTLASNDPRDYPLINPNYLSDETDLEVMYQGVQAALKLADTDSYKAINGTPYVVAVPYCDSKYDRLISKDWWYCAFKYLATTVYHPMGTTRMGVAGNNSVVNYDLKVHGVKQLRVVDAGVLPSTISGHTNAVTVMIAEKISDVIKAEHRPKQKENRTTASSN